MEGSSGFDGWKVFFVAMEACVKFDASAGAWRANTLDLYFDAPRAKKLQLIRGVVEGLCYLHSRSPAVLHRDIKPANILIGTDGRAKVRGERERRMVVLKFHLTSPHLSSQLADFGHSQSARGDGMSVSRSVLATGTEAWSSPKQLDLIGAESRYRAQSDVFSLGLVFFDLFSGQRKAGEMSFRHADKAEVKWSFGAKWRCT